MYNSELTVYRKSLDENHDEIWTRYNYSKVWWYGGKGVGLNSGLEKSNDVKIRIWYNLNPNLNISNFKVGDILIKGRIEQDITSIKQLKEYDTYQITSINDDTNGARPHIYLGGK